MTDKRRAFGRYFDNPDDLFNWLNQAVFGTAVMNALNRAGVTARILEGPVSVAELADAGDIPADLLGRMIDFLAAHEMLELDADGLVRGSSRTAMMLEASGFLTNVEISGRACAQLLPALREGKTPFEKAYGEPVFDYFHSHPDMAAGFGQFMGFMTRRVQRFIFSQHRFQPFETVADIGGSMGDMLLAILGEYPGTRGIVFDRPDVIEIARPKVEASPLAERVELVGGSFFEAVPAADLYILKQILHDWDDEECRRILGSIRAAMKPGARLAVIDHLLSDIPQPDESIGTDIAMMVWDTGRERKQSDFEALFTSAGFRIDRVTPNPNGHSVIEVVPV
ncbi:methyltransferase [Alteraurantiacibacter aestuarii]|uniref:O-methyltransferase C-terminal domain-containing protein n=1 Tax=Alteraurantiacibacter aestuarii TaxID=650004 RepID=A0A844ZLZ5_9SPHN|nr:methyltransferase [Alteraurantiacibacter aestuarii]MXO87857.1 hypothetical protein [Alteraurantiacibacter aestuarii]